MLLYSPETVYQLDKAAVVSDGFAEIELMQRAGRSVWRALQARWPQVEKITVFAGCGNNGGDAFVVALCARAQGVAVQLLVQGDLSRQSETSRHFAALWQQDGGTFEDWQGQELSGDVIVDGLLGIGLQRELNAPWQDLINTINRQASPRVAIDIPSGLNGLTGNPQPVAVTAQLTVTFIGAKTGQYLADGPDYCGELIFEDLGVSARARAEVAAQLEIVDSCQLPAPRKKNSHKNHYGNLLIIGGDQGMSGAVTLAARAALRSGAGLVTALVHPECRANLAAFPEIMVQGWDALAAKLPQASVVIVGPGLGDSAEAGRLLQRLQQVSVPMVVDASALQADFLTVAGVGAMRDYTSSRRSRGADVLFDGRDSGRSPGGQRRACRAVPCHLRAQGLRHADRASGRIDGDQYAWQCGHGKRRHGRRAERDHWRIHRAGPVAVCRGALGGFDSRAVRRVL